MRVSAVRFLTGAALLSRYVLAVIALGSLAVFAGVAAGHKPDQVAPTPSRIITIAPNAAEIICALGACDAIVGVDRFCVFPPVLSSRPRVGGLFDPDLERIVSLKPDLVVLRGHSETLERLCARLKIPIYHDATERLEQIPATIRDLAALLNRGEQGQRLIESFERGIQRVRSRVAGRERPRVLLTVSRRPDRFADILTVGRGVFLSEMLEVAGGINVFGDVDMGYPQVSVESILVRRPDVIVELMPEIEMTPGLRDRILQDWNRLGPIPAVEQGRVHILTDDHCLIPSPRYVEIIERVSQILHPEPVGARRTGNSGSE